MAYDFQYEHFNSIYDFERAVNGRSVNPPHRSKQSSQKQDFNFSQTNSYEEANSLLKNGWNTEVESIERELRKFSSTVTVKHNRQIKSIAGYAPCVANAIRGVPKSMFATKTVKHEEKKRYIHLVFNNCASYGTSSDTLMKSGMTVLKLATVLDKMGIRTKIDMIPIMSYSDKSVYGCTVSIKDYRQPFNVSKIAYPVAHVAFFRRHGFRFYETMSDFKNYDMALNYGAPLILGTETTNNYFKFARFMKDDVVYIDLTDVRKADFDYVKLAENKGIAL